LVRQPCVRLFRRRRRVEADDPRGLGQRRRTSGLPQNDRLYGVTSTWNQSDDHELQRHRLKNNNNTSSLNLKKKTLLIGDFGSKYCILSQKLFITLVFKKNTIFSENE
jgi:hypothetical protein